MFNFPELPDLSKITPPQVDYDAVIQAINETQAERDRKERKSRNIAMAALIVGILALLIAAYSATVTTRQFHSANSITPIPLRLDDTTQSHRQSIFQ